VYGDAVFCPRSSAQAVPFGDHHLYQLATALFERMQLALCLIAQPGRRRLHNFAEAGEDASIDSVSFGQLPE